MRKRLICLVRMVHLCTVQAVLFCCQSRTDFLCGISELAQLSVSILAGFVGFLDGIGEVLGFISGFVNAFGGFFSGGVSL